MQRFTLLAAALTLLLAARVVAQSQSDKKLSFEVVSVKPNRDINGPPSFSGGGGRQTFIAATARTLILHAFALRDYEISGGPSWLDDERFDVNAKAEGNPTRDELRLMMRALLEERFGLKYRHEPREGPIYRLTRARKDGALGTQLVKSDVDCAEFVRRGKPAADVRGGFAPPCTGRMGIGQIVAGSEPFAQLVSWLESVAGRRIIDETGLTGTYDVSLTWADTEADTTRPSLFTAVQEQLGLKLEPGRGPVNMLVIEHIERPTPD